MSPKRTWPPVKSGGIPKAALLSSAELSDKISRHGMVAQALCLPGRDSSRPLSCETRKERPDESGRSRHERESALWAVSSGTNHRRRSRRGRPQKTMACPTGRCLCLKGLRRRRDCVVSGECLRHGELQKVTRMAIWTRRAGRAVVGRRNAVFTCCICVLNCAVELIALNCVWLKVL